MRIIKLLTGIALLLLCSCTTHLGDAKIIDRDYCTVGGKAFDGKLWSSDEKTICAFCEDGRIVRVEGYFENGDRAFQVVNIDGRLKRTYYDQDGHEVTKESFKIKYNQLYKQIQRAQSEVHEQRHD